MPNTSSGNERESFRVVDVDEDHAKAVAFNMVFMVWRRRTLTAPYRRGIQLVQEVAKKFPEGVGVCQVVEVESIPPDSDARRAFVDSLKVPVIKHLSVIHDGAGFKAAAVRAIMTTTYALARPQFKLAVHASVSDAARWHASAQADLGRRESAGLIEGIIRGLRDLHRERYP